jgi:hypothetical protein
MKTSMGIVIGIEEAMKKTSRFANSNGLWSGKLGCTKVIHAATFIDLFEQ